ncbi:MAG: head GIN domain-containing protein [Enhygromyxa sp.]
MTTPSVVPRLLALSLFALALLPGCGLRGSGTAATEQREVEGFDRIELSGGYDLVVHVEPGVAHKLEITADDNIVGKITTTVVDGELEVGREDVKLLRTKTPIRVEVWVPELLAIEASGAADIEVEGLHGESFELELSGASESTLRGTVERFAVKASGAATLEAVGLKAEAVTIALSGAGGATVWASESLDVEISGAGKVIYWGDPASIRERISGTGKLEAR